MDSDEQARITAFCPACMGAGEQISSAEDGAPCFTDCMNCEGKGRVLLPCSAEDFDEVAESAFVMAMHRARQDAIARLKDAGICPWCFGSGRVVLVDRDENGRPISVSEVPCPKLPPDPDGPLH